MARKQGVIKRLKKDKLLLIEVLTFSAILLLVIGLAVYSFLIPRHTVIFNTNGGTTITSKRVKHNKTVLEPVSPVRDGYKFLGWYYNEEKYSFKNKITEDIVLEAKWEKQDLEQVESITLDIEEFSMKPNAVVKLPYTVSPDKDAKVYWESSDNSIVEVDDSGNVTAKKEGVVTIKISASNGLSDSISIIVDENAVSISSISFEEKEITVEKGTVKQLNLIVEPLDSSNQNFIWTSDNTSVVSVDKYGVISAKKEGQVLIIVTSLDGDKIARCKINVIGV